MNILSAVRRIAPDAHQRTIVLIWAFWAIALISFQAISVERVRLERPDYAVSWSEWETDANNNADKPYLSDRFMNQQVAWDSEYYLGIAVGGYDDPLAGTATDPDTGKEIPRNYSFFPGYPALINLLAWPLYIFNITAIARATLAGMIITLLGTLGGMFALDYLVRRTYAKAKQRSDEATSTAIRTLTYLLVFPGALFFAQVYTEGLFIGTALGAIALAYRGRWGFAALLAGLATLTRAHGVLTVIPLAIIWWTSGGSAQLKLLASGKGATTLRARLTALLPVFAILLPIVVHLLWRTSTLGEGWARLQDFYFGRGYLSIPESIGSWIVGGVYAFTHGHEALVTFLLDRAAIFLALAASIALLRRREWAIGAFSLALVVASGLSGDHQSTIRYMAVVPALPIWLAGIGRRAWFDRVWVIGCVLLLGLLALLFSRDFWVA